MVSLLARCIAVFLDCLAYQVREQGRTAATGRRTMWRDLGLSRLFAGAPAVVLHSLGCVHVMLRPARLPKGAHTYPAMAVRSPPWRRPSAWIATWAKCLGN